jgi:hypothetical protein
MLPILPTLFCLILVKFSVGDLHVMLLRTCAVGAIFHVGVQLNFAYILYIFFQFGYSAIQQMATKIY